MRDGIYETNKDWIEKDSKQSVKLGNLKNWKETGK